MTADRTAYRPDIDGLRAIAVLGVIFFHAGFQWITGGFIGVDVFFVISGYLITGILLRELRDNRFSLTRFYERRARRILPALVVVLGATLAVSALIMLPGDLRVAARSAVSVLVFAANILFWRGVDFVDKTLINYFGLRLHEQPLIHTWTLGVEEQYYLLFPLTLLAVWRLRQSWVLPVLIAGTLASFALSAWLTPRSPGIAFYLLPTRLWELLAGGVLAWRSPQTGGPRITQMTQIANGARDIVAGIGLGLILVPMALYDSSTRFPGIHAAAPVVGAMLLIGYAPGSAIGRFLSTRAMVFVGLISYSAYLWHQPLFALARYTSLTGEMSAALALVLCVVTIVLAAITWRWVETPFRDRQRVSTRALVWSCVIGIAAVATPSAILAFGGDAGRRTPIASGVVGQSVLALFSDCNISLQPTRGLGLGCLLDPSSEAPPSFLVIGDSHADALYPAFAKASRDTGRQGRLLQNFACSPVLDPTDSSFGTPDCMRMHEQALATVTEHKIDRVFLVSRYAHDYMPRELFPRRLEKTIATYSERGAVVYIVLQAPEQPRFDRRVYLRALLRRRFLGEDPSTVARNLSVTRAEHEQRQEFVRGVFEKYQNDPRVRFVDFTSAFCDTGTCVAGSVAAPYYVDDHHLSVTGAVLISGAISSAVRP